MFLVMRRAMAAGVIVGTWSWDVASDRLHIDESLADALGLDPALVTPRLDSPRLAVPAGAVGVAGEQTGVYPETSPGGWNILGMTKPELLYAIEPGDTVVFERAE